MFALLWKAGKWKVLYLTQVVNRQVQLKVMFLYIFDGPIAFDGWKGEGITFKLSGK